MTTADINSMSDEEYLQLLKSRSGNMTFVEPPDDTVIVTDENGRVYTWADFRRIHKAALEKVKGLKV